jgi:hypothetical protein
MDLGSGRAKYLFFWEKAKNMAVFLVLNTCFWGQKWRFKSFLSPGRFSAREKKRRFLASNHVIDQIQLPEIIVAEEMGPFQPRGKQVTFIIYHSCPGKIPAN